jgi:hypothetical protein
MAASSPTTKPISSAARERTMRDTLRTVLGQNKGASSNATGARAAAE